MNVNRVGLILGGVALILVGCQGSTASSGKTSASTTATVTSGTGTGTGAVTSTTTTSPLGLAITTLALPNATVGAPYAASLLESGGTAPFSWAIASGALPAGLALSANGAIDGTATAAGAASFTVTVTDATGATATATLSITSTGALATGPGTWTDLSSPRMPAQVATHASAAVGGQIFSFGGFSPPGTLLQTITRFDPVAQTCVTETAKLPQPLGYMCAVTCGSKIYTFGGSDGGGMYDVVFSYDPVAHTLASLAPLPQERDSLAGAAVGSDIYLFGGSYLDLTGSFSATATQTIWKYSTTANSWTTLSVTMPDPIQWACAVTVNGKIYVSGGADFTVDLFSSAQTTVKNYATCYEFDPVAGTLTAKSPLPIGVKMLVGDAINGQVYVTSGETTTGLHSNSAPWANPSAKTFRYDPPTDTWQTLADMTTNVVGVGPFGGRALAGAAQVDHQLYLLGGFTLPTPNATSTPPPTSLGEVDQISSFAP